MHDFQRHAAPHQRARPPGCCAGRPPIRRRRRTSGACPACGRRDPSFVIRDGMLEVLDPRSSSASRRRCSASSRWRSSATCRSGCAPPTSSAEQAAHGRRGPARDPDSAPRFLAVLTDVRDAATPSRLEQMNDLGLLAALMPEWEPIIGRVQHDLYHVYTVDQHSLYAVALLKALAPARARQRRARGHRGVRADRQRPVPLYLADAPARRGQGGGQEPLGQGRGPGADHRAPARFCADDVRRVEFLVREHLTMAHMSQRRDLNDRD